jgi:hypothetical protein
MNSQYFRIITVIGCGTMPGLSAIAEIKSAALLKLE